jgi:hypothetical protein
MLLGLALAALPILIHLWTKREHRREPWAAMAFLRRALERRRRQLRLESLLLLLLRTAIICLCVLALAEPRLSTSSGLATQREPALRILLVDQSASLAWRQGGTSGWDRVRNEIGRCIADSVPGDRYSLVRICSSLPKTIIGQPTSDPGEIEAELNRWPLTGERGNVSESLTQVIELLRQNDDPARREVVILSDLQASNWIPAGAVDRTLLQSQLRAMADLATVQVIDVGTGDRNNLAITSLGASRPLAAPGELVTWSATIRNFTPSPVSTRLEWRVGTTVEDIAPVDLPPLGETVAQFSTAAAGDWSCDVTVRLLHEDAFATDNQRFATIPLREQLRVLLVEGRPEHRPAAGALDFVELALGMPQSSGTPSARPRRVRWQTTTVPETRFSDSHLRQADIVWLADVPRLRRETADRLSDWVRRGGGLIISVGESLDLETYNNQLWGDGAGLLPAKLAAIQDAPADEEFLTFQPTDPPHPLVADLVGNPDAGLLTTFVKRFLSVEPETAKGSRVVLELSDLSPVILERAFGSGRAILVLTSVDDAWGNWAVWPSFVPLVHRLVALAAGSPDDSRELRVGDAIHRTLTPLEAEARLTLPDGTVVAPELERDGGDTRLRLAQTPAAGFYHLELGAPLNRRETLAVNLDPDESDPRHATAEEFAGRQTPIAGISWGSEWTPPASSESAAETGAFAGPLLVAALIVLMVEQMMAWRTNVGLIAVVLSVAAVLLWRVAIAGGWWALAGVLLLFALSAVLWARLTADSRR